MRGATATIPKLACVSDLSRINCLDLRTSLPWLFQQIGGNSWLFCFIQVTGGLILLVRLRTIADTGQCVVGNISGRVSIGVGKSGCLLLFEKFGILSF